jgi:hypothetical protein
MLTGMSVSRSRDRGPTFSSCGGLVGQVLIVATLTILPFPPATIWAPFSLSRWLRFSKQPAGTLMPLSGFIAGPFDQEAANTGAII